MRAEEYYGRAILASPGNGELLSLYGKLIWESHRDGERAKSYFDQSVRASPDDWYCLFVCLVVFFPRLCYLFFNFFFFLGHIF